MNMQNARVFYFNPTCELAVANGSFSYMPPVLLRRFESDCAMLPFILSGKGDQVLTTEAPSPEFTKRLNEAGFSLPSFGPLSALISANLESIGELCPWGWSPAAHHFLKDLKEICADEYRQSPVFDWKPEHRKLFERETSLRFLIEFLKDHPADSYIGMELTGMKAESPEEIDELLKKNCPIVLKAPLSSSGRGIQIVRKLQLNQSNRQWINGVLKQQKYLVAEPYLDKIADFSFQFHVKNEKEVEYLGIPVFETNQNGQYKSTLLRPENGSFLNSEMIRNHSEIIEKTADLLKRSLSDSIYARAHRGFLGIDAMLFELNGKVYMQPCVEINCRTTMGIVAKYLEKRIDPDSTGKFELFRGVPGDFGKYCQEKSNSHPITLRNGSIKSGFLPLVEPDSHKVFGAFMMISEGKQQ